MTNLPPLKAMSALGSNDKFVDLRPAMEAILEARRQGVSLTLDEDLSVDAEWDEDAPPSEDLLDWLRQLKASIVRILDVELITGRQVIRIERKGSKAKPLNRFVFEEGFPRGFE